PEENEQRQRVHEELVAIRKELRQEHLEVVDAFQAWLDEQELASETISERQTWTPLEFDFLENTIGGQKFFRKPDGSYRGEGYAPTLANPQGDAIVHLPTVSAMRLELLNDDNLPHSGPGRSVDGTWALTDINVFYSHNEGKDWKKAKLIAADATIHPPRQRLDPRYFAKQPNRKRVTGGVGYAIDGDDNTAWTGSLGPGRRNDPQTGWFKFSQPIASQNGKPILLRVELRQRHGGWNSDDNQNFNIGCFRVSVTEGDYAVDSLPPKLRSAVEQDRLSTDQRDALFDHFVAQQTSLRSWQKRMEDAWEIYPSGTSQLVLKARDEARQTHRLERGDFLSPRESVDPAVPQFLHAINDRDADGKLDRLDFAHWMVDEKSPTTARSIVNRIWQAYFANGITLTSDDLGLQGEPPTHPDLLDWLAVDLMASGWKLKSLHRRIVMSATYRQSSDFNEDLLQRDPQNRYLARSPRIRVPAETVRDIALSASGLLNPQIGGRPVYPPAPDFLFEPPASYGPKTWNDELDEQKYRRAFYTFRFRSVPYPAFQAFDAPTGEVSCVRRSQSNTPLQALVTLNEPLYLECAQHLAIEVLSADMQSDVERFELLYQRCLSRYPDDREIEVMQRMLDQQQERMKEDLDLAKSLVGDPTIASDSDSIAQQAAWTAICRVVLNLDEAITKE
ncbi:DUF1553 domain-containing protein, partial [Rubripirellula amarantea]|nr:DUF1553 domain-containing protein [Rubripirellula amarantea]